MSRAVDRVEAAIGLTVAAIAAYVVGTLATGLWGGTGGWTTRSAYDLAAWLFIAVIVAAALAAAAGKHADLRRAAALVSAAGLAGRAVVAHRRWFTAGGFSSNALNLDRLRSLAVMLAIAATCLVVFVVTLMAPSILRARPRLPLTVAGLLLAAATACAVPFLMGDEYGESTTTSIGAHALLYSIPWAIAVGLVFVGSRSAAVGISIVVFVHQLTMVVDGPPVIPMRNPVVGSVVALAALGAGLIIPERRTMIHAGSGDE
jgi:hypothetical protein